MYNQRTYLFGASDILTEAHTTYITLSGDCVSNVSSCIYIYILPVPTIKLKLIGKKT